MAESRMTDYDMQQVVIKKKLPKTGHLTSDQALSAALKAGVAVDTEKKYAAGSNKQHANTAIHISKLDNPEPEDLHTPVVGMDVSRAIQQARQNMNPPMTQKDLAQRVNEKPQVINDYEAGRAIPNQQILGKLERALGVKLRGKDIGKPLGGPKGK